MATLQQQVQQAQATVTMLERMVKARRATDQELTAARERLVALTAPVVSVVTRYRADDEPTPVVDRPEPTGRAVEADEYLELQSELSKDGDRLNRQMAELSNQLHKVPPGQSCAELTRPILALKDQIESIWDKKRYLERNRAVMPDTPDEPETEENSSQKFALSYEKRRLVDLRSKLKKKLQNPAAKPGKVQAWREELQRANLEVAEIDIKLGTL